MITAAGPPSAPVKILLMLYFAAISGSQGWRLGSSGWATLTGSEAGKVSSSPSSRASSIRCFSRDSAPSRAWLVSCLGLEPDRDIRASMRRLNLAGASTVLDDIAHRDYKADNSKTNVRGGNGHEAHHLHRGSAPAAQAAGAEGLLRLCRPRLLCRADAARQSRRSAEDQVSPAHPGRRLQARHRDHHSRRALDDAADPGAGGTARHAAWRRRDPCL